MARALVLGQYIAEESWLHGLAARGKLIDSILLAGVVFFCVSWVDYLIVGTVLVSLLVGAKLSLTQVFRSLRPLLVFIGLTLCLHAFTTPGTIWWHWGWLQLTPQGLVQGTLLSLRLIYLVALSIVLMSTTTPIALTSALEELLHPLNRLKVPVAHLALMVGIAMRFIPIIFEEAQKLQRAQASRGGAIGVGSWYERIYALYAMLIPLVVLTFKRARDLSVAMEARCYQGSFTRVRAEARFQVKDWAAFGVCIGLMGLIWWLP